MAKSPVLCSRPWRRRRDIPSRCSSSTCGSTTTWASTRSSASRSSRPSRSASRRCLRPVPSRSGPSALCAISSHLLESGAPHCRWRTLLARPPRPRKLPTGRIPRHVIGRPHPARRGGREDGVSGRDARPGHAARRRPGHRLDQARRDPLGRAGSAARDAFDRAGADRHTAHPSRDRRVPRSRPACVRARDAGDEWTGFGHSGY